jgi:hypothetical protein
MGSAVGSGVASGDNGKVASGTSDPCGKGRGVTIAIVPLAWAVIVASVCAGTSEPVFSTKFFP